MMDFEGKQEMMQKVQQNGGMYQQMLAMQQQMLQLSQIVDQLTGGQTNLGDQTAQQINSNLDSASQQGAGGGSANAQIPQLTKTSSENPIPARARQQASQANTPT